MQNLEDIFPNHNVEELRDVANSSLNMEDAVAAILDTPDVIELETGPQMDSGKYFTFNKINKMQSCVKGWGECFFKCGTQKMIISIENVYK